MKLMLNGKEVTGMGHYVMAGDIKDATAEDSNVLSGKAYYNNNGKREGTMPNRGGMSAELAAGGSVSIPEGYHNGEGVVRAQDLASQTQGTAAAANIEAGYTAWVNGEMVEGTHVCTPSFANVSMKSQSGVNIRTRSAASVNLTVNSPSIYLGKFCELVGIGGTVRGVAYYSANDNSLSIYACNHSARDAVGFNQGVSYTVKVYDL